MSSYHSDHNEENPFLEAALQYAAWGYPVFPIKPLRKEPATDHGFKDATTDPDQIRKWWTENPNYNIGLATAGIIVIDKDGEAGMAWPCDPDRMADLALCGSVQETWSGGMHCVYGQPEGANWGCTKGDLAKGVDTRGHGGYIVVAPSKVDPAKYPSKVPLKGATGRYAWLDGQELGPRDQLGKPPAWLAEMLSKLRKVGEGSALPKWEPREYTPEEFREIFSSLPLFAAIYGTEKAREALIENGWQVHSIHDDGEVRLTRPDKNVKDGCSASWNHPNGKSRQWGFPRLAIHSMEDDANPFIKMRKQDDPNREKYRSYSAFDILRTYDPEALQSIERERQINYDMENGEFGGDAGEGCEGPTGEAEATGDLILRKLGTVKPERIDWLSRGFLPLGKATLLVASAGCGKSSVARCAMGHLVRGEGLLSYHGGPVEIIILTTEDSEGEHFVPAMLAEGCTKDEMDRIYVCHGVRVGEDGEGPVTNREFGKLDGILKANPNIKLIFVDPLAGLVSASGCEINSSEGARDVTGRLHEMAKKHNIAVLILGHEVKSKEVTGAAKAAGSHQHSASVRLHWRLVPHGNGVSLQWTKGNVSGWDKKKALHFRMEEIGEEAARMLLEENGYDVAEFVGPETGAEPWGQFIRQEVTIVDAGGCSTNLSNLFSAEDLAEMAKEEHDMRKEQEARDKALQVVEDALRKKGGPVSEKGFTQSVLFQNVGLRPSHVDGAIAFLVDPDGAGAITRIPGVGSKGAELVHNDHLKQAENTPEKAPETNNKKQRKKRAQNTGQRKTAKSKRK